MRVARTVNHQKPPLRRSNHATQIRKNPQTSSLPLGEQVSLSAITDVAWQLYWARRYGDAIVHARKVVELDSTYYPAHVCLGLAYQQNHEFSLSIAERKSATGFRREKCFG